MQPKQITISLVSLILVLFANNSSFAQQNAMEDDIIKISGITTGTQAYPLTSSQKQTTVVYYDGFGRPIQEVAQYASPLQNDIVQPMVYDNLGRQTQQYLPYADAATETGTVVAGNYRSTALSEQSSFYGNTGQYLVATDADPFKQQYYENSPLQRLLQSGQMGSGFQPITGPHYKTINYRPNSNALDGNIAITGTTGSFTTYYPDNTLWVTDGKDEDNEETLIYKDYLGHVILKRQLSGIVAEPYFDTYYIYNNAGSIAYVVPPKATHLILTNSGYTLSTPAVANLIYSYLYNSHGQIYSKTVPGSGQVSIIYDPLNRPVLAQDVNNAALYQWNYIKYDAKGRPAITGFYTDPSHYNPSQMQMYVTNNYGTTYWFESRSTSYTYFYYTNNAFPTTNTTALNYSWYDNYNWNNDGSSVFAFSTPTGIPTTGPEGQTIPVPAATLQTVKGMPTITLTQVIGPGLSSSLKMLKVIFYDDYGRPIQQRSTNQLYWSLSTLTDAKTSAIDFSGKTWATQLVVQTASGTTNKILTTYNYDSSNRPADVDQVYNSQANVHIAHYNYNEIGQLISKNLGYNTTASAYIQTVNQRYNIRGQLIYINNSKLMNDGGKTSNESTDLFGMQLLYDGTDSNLGTTTPSYTGRVSAVKWMTVNSSGASNVLDERSYVYSYDQLGRYTGSIYAERGNTASGAFNINNDGFDETGITYDDGGNILTLQRNSSSIDATSHIQVDNLTYTYDTTLPNQLDAVSDGTGSNYTSYGFRNYSASTGPYIYDNEGNLKTDPYKQLNIQYTASINRALTITQTASAANGAYVSYTYDGVGNVMRKQVYSNSTTLQSTADYIDGLVFTTTGSTTALSYFAMPEGRVINNGTTFVPEYVITDNMGNARFSFTDNGSGGVTIRQENSYYAFGEVLANSPISTPTTNPNINIYNGGSEWQNEFNNLLDYNQTFFRNYDPAIGRFIASDSEPESAESMTTYQYAGNDPVINIDPIGDTYQPQNPHNRRGRGNPYNDPYSNQNGDNFDWLENGNADPSFDDASDNYGYDAYGNYSPVPIDYAHESSSTVAALAAQGDPGAIAALQSYGVNNGTTYTVVWNPYGGAEVSKADWIAAGGNINQYNYALSVNNGSDANFTYNLGAYTLKPLNSIGPSSFNLTYGTSAYGAFLKINFNDPELMYMYKSFNWIQTVSSSGEFEQENGYKLHDPHVDGSRNLNGTLKNYPFYLTNFEANFESPSPFGGSMSFFGDGALGETYFVGEATLVGIGFDGRLTALGSFTWGYVNNDGTATMIPPVYSPTPSQFQQQIIKNYNNRGQ